MILIRTLPRLASCLGLAALLLASGCSSFSNWDGRDRSLSTSPGKPAASGVLDQSPEGLYAAGVEALQQKRYPAAVDLFDRVERDHPYSAWATNATLMAAYA